MPLLPLAKDRESSHLCKAQIPILNSFLFYKLKSKKIEFQNRGGKYEYYNT